MSLLTNPLVWLLVLALSVAGVGSASIPYYLGNRGVEAVVERFPHLGEQRLRRVEQLYGEHGSALLFFSFVPMLGLLLSAGAGIVGVPRSSFVIWVLIGRIVRNSIVLVLVNQGLHTLLGR